MTPQRWSGAFGTIYSASQTIAVADIGLAEPVDLTTSSGVQRAIDSIRQHPSGPPIGLVEAVNLAHTFHADEPLITFATIIATPSIGERCAQLLADHGLPEHTKGSQ